MIRLAFLFFVVTQFTFGQFSKEDTIRGSITPERAWWDVMHYDLVVDVQPATKSINGFNKILFQANEFGTKRMQIDLMEPMQIDSVIFQESKVDFQRVTTSAYYLTLDIQAKEFEQLQTIYIYFSGQPIEAKNAPWDGGIVWSKDESGDHFIASAIQGIGASAWWPCKDHWSEEPNLGMNITLSCPPNLMAVSNGKLVNHYQNVLNRTITKWKVQNPINAYGINFNIGNYTHWTDTFIGIAGKLPLDYFVLPENLEKSKIQFKDVNRTLEAFEYWFGPYPFYEDGYKLVEVPYLGMEHQSSVTYGNGYKNGYKGTDLSGTGWGLKWDFIIVHESGHEWFANNITAADPADMWIHEAFTTYSEALFTEYFYGKEAGAAYVRGLRKNILNDRPIIGQYDVHHEGSYDMYPKGANMLHTIRQIVNNDSLWRNTLIQLNTTFRHRIVRASDIEQFMIEQLQIDLQPVFDHYLRKTTIPQLALKHKRKKVLYKWTNIQAAFCMPVDAKINEQWQRLIPTSKWKKVKASSFQISPDYYIKSFKN